MNFLVTTLNLMKTIDTYLAAHLKVYSNLLRLKMTASSSWVCVGSMGTAPLHGYGTAPKCSPDEPPQTTGTRNCHVT